MKKLFLGMTIICLLLDGCGPAFLDVKRDLSQEVPTKLEDFDLMLANTTVFNHTSGHVMGSIAGEEFHLSQSAFDQLGQPYEKNTYLWRDEEFVGNEAMDWNHPYQRILYCNVILDGLARPDLQMDDNERYDRIMGEALFHRANAEYMLSQQFAAVYGDDGHSEFGIPLIHNVNPTAISVRSTVTETYRSIEDDLNKSAGLLKESSSNIFRPNRISALGLLARLNLVKGDYEKALRFAEEALRYKNSLMDYATVSKGPDYIFPINGKDNAEIIFYDVSFYGLALLRDKYRANDDLLKLYTKGDLRRELYFRPETSGGYSYRGSYTGGGNFFTGIATDELHLIASESAIRTGEISLGLDYLNMLLSARFTAGSFSPFKNIEPSDALDVVLTERRKSMPNRGLRWSDLRRLNFLDGENLQLSRQMNGATFELGGMDRRFIFLAPSNVIDRSEVQQIPR